MIQPETAEELLNIARPLFEQHGPNFPLKSFIRASGVPETRIIRFFDRWTGLKAALGYPAVNAPRRVVGPKRTAGAILEALRAILPEAGNKISLCEFVRRTGISSTCIYLQFGSWTELRRQAGLPRNATRGRDYTDEHLLIDMLRVALLTGEDVTQAVYETHGLINVSTLQRRFGSFKKASAIQAEYTWELYERLPDKAAQAEYIMRRIAEIEAIRRKSFPAPIATSPRTPRVNVPLEDAPFPPFDVNWRPQPIGPQGFRDYCREQQRKALMNESAPR
jgi:hypothetical protein